MYNHTQQTQYKREKKVERSSSDELTAEERQMIEAVKESHPEYRHRRIQGVLQQRVYYRPRQSTGI